MNNWNLILIFDYQIKAHLWFTIEYQEHFLKFHFENKRVDNHALNHLMITKF